MKLFTKSNQRGFGHVELVLLIAFVAVFAFIGVRVIHQSSALTLLNQKQCTLMGRTWSSAGTCNKVCAAGQGTYVVTSTYDYCSSAVTKASSMSAATCASYGRVALASASTYVGCARRADQKTTAKAPQCANAANTYYVQSTYDKCGVPLATNIVSCTISASPTPTAGKLSTYTFTVKNGTTTKYDNVLTEIGTGIGSRGTLLKDVMFGTVSAGQTKTVTTTITAPTDSGSFLSMQIGTPTLNFSASNGCAKTYNF